MKVIAMYLPQFHSIPENDGWWGEGFTEWTAVRAAKPLFDGHRQPREPLGGRYYDLLDKKTMLWQSKLMHEYGIDGVCIYHYWFMEGRRILEKPERNLLRWKDIDMPFCLCWANETWARSWSKISGWKNEWAKEFESERNNENEDGILLQQEYGEKPEWEAHFEYLYPFFTDERYIRIDGKPVIVIYQTADIECIREMIDCWSDCAKEYGLNGVYVIGGGCVEDLAGILDGQLYRQPARTYNRLKRGIKEDREKIELFDGEFFLMDTLKIQRENNLKPYFMGITGFDNTPRNGDAGYALTNVDLSVYKEYLVRLLAKNDLCGSDVTFINAWNEWGEGMYLEPDSDFGFGLLEAVREAKGIFESQSIVYKASYLEKDIRDRDLEYIKLYNLQRRTEENLSILSAWVELSESGEDISKLIRGAVGDEVGIYGYGIIGKKLVKKLESSGIRVRFIIDKTFTNNGTENGIIAYDTESIPDTDIPMIISVGYECESIGNFLIRRGYKGKILLFSKWLKEFVTELKI